MKYAAIDSDGILTEKAVVIIVSTLDYIYIGLLFGLMGSHEIELSVEAAEGFLSKSAVGNACELKLKRSYVKLMQVSGLYPSPTGTRTYEIEAKNLSYKLEESKKTWFNSNAVDEGNGRSRYILRNLNCKAKPGEILAIAGPSGAGKSTLLELLAGKIKPNSPPESLLVNHQPMNSEKFRKISGYVTQDDALFPLLTVQETLMFSARLRLCSRRYSEADKNGRVRDLMEELGLQHVADSRIGNEKIRGISGGERRRVSIGVDVIHDPAVLLLDEPTSRLDSFAALKIMKILKSMAELRGRTVILSIHQPGFRILELFDSILLLSNGSTVYHGPLEMLESSLVSAGHRIVAHVNILEYALDAMKNHGFSNNGKNHGRVKVTLYDLFLHSRQINHVTELNAMRFAGSRLHEITVLTHRFFLNIYRTKDLFAVRTAQAMGAGICLGSIFYSGSDPGERMGLFAFSLTFLLSSSTEGLPVFVQERNILSKESYGGAYRVSSYVIANAIVFIPFMLIVALVFSIPVYWLAGLNNRPSAFLYFVLVIWVAVYSANSMVALFSAVVPNYIMGTTLITGCLGAFFLFSGFFVSKNQIPRYWRFVHYLSLFKYPLESLLINEYWGNEKKCLVFVLGKCMLDVDGVMAEQGLKASNRWMNLLVMLAFIFAYRFLSFVILRFRCSHRKSSVLL